MIPKDDFLRDLVRANESHGVEMTHEEFKAFIVETCNKYKDNKEFLDLIRRKISNYRQQYLNFFDICRLLS